MHACTLQPSVSFRRSSPAFSIAGCRALCGPPVSFSGWSLSPQPWEPLSLPALHSTLDNLMWTCGFDASRGQGPSDLPSSAHVGVLERPQLQTPGDVRSSDCPSPTLYPSAHPLHHSAWLLPSPQPPSHILGLPVSVLLGVCHEHTVQLPPRPLLAPGLLQWPVPRSCIQSRAHCSREGSQCPALASQPWPPPGLPALSLIPIPPHTHAITTLVDASLQTLPVAPGSAKAPRPPQSLPSWAACHYEHCWGRPASAEVQAQNRPWGILEEPPNFPQRPQELSIMQIIRWRSTIPEPTGLAGVGTS